MKVLSRRVHLSGMWLGDDLYRADPPMTTLTLTPLTPIPSGTAKAANKMAKKLEMAQRLIAALKDENERWKVWVRNMGW